MDYIGLQVEDAESHHCPDGHDDVVDVPPVVPVVPLEVEPVLEVDVVTQLEPFQYWPDGQSVDDVFTQLEPFQYCPDEHEEYEEDVLGMLQWPDTLSHVPPADVQPPSPLQAEVEDV